MSNSLKLVFERQFIYYLVLLVLLLSINFVVDVTPSIYDGSFLGVSSKSWFILSIITVVIHQFYSWFFLRTELHYRLMTKWFGQRAFYVWKLFFVPLLVLRFVLVFIVGISNMGSFAGLDTTLGWITTLILVIPASHTLYSLYKYLTLDRAFGLDHFNPEIGKQGLVRDGMYKYTSNAIYIFIGLTLFIPTLIFASYGAFISGIFNYLSLWLIYFTLELPDIKRIYFNKVTIQ